MAKVSGMPVASIRPGTIRKPPPMPKKPENRPTPKPMPSSGGRSRLAVAGDQADLRIATGAAPTQHDDADDDHHEAEQGEQLLAVDRLGGRRAAKAPRTPAAANTAAQRHFTLPSRQCGRRLPSALAETATALVPIATCGEATPTT